MRRSLLAIISALVGVMLIALATFYVVAPRIDWGAEQQPGAVENAVASRILARWIARGAPAVTNPISATTDNLSSGRDEYNEHCAICHGLDGSGRDQLQADFLPRVPGLTGDVQDLSDGELYFVISHGIRNTAMPSFAARHSRDEIWKTILWVRHFAHLTPEERKRIAQQTSDREQGHEKIMRQGPNSATPK
jgi:mono/diheme cytochrome c family protein